MPVYKSSPERTRRIFGSGIILGSRPAVPSSPPSQDVNKQMGSHTVDDTSLMTSDQEEQLREIMNEQFTKDCPRWVFEKFEHIKDDQTESR